MSNRPSQRSRQKGASHDVPHGGATSRGEWVTAGLGLLLVLATVGYLGYEALTTDPVAPDISIEQIATEKTAGGYIVRFRATNSGAATAAALAVLGELHDGTATIEESEVVLDYLPSHSHRQGGLIFQNDPAGYDLKLEAKGYIDP